MKLSTAGTSSRHGLITGVVCLALAAVVAAMASLNVALPDIARATHASQTDLVWVIDAYSLAFAALLLPAGGIGDRYGRRVALVIGLVIFGGGSAVAMTASSSSELIALRAIIGVGAALVMPATLSTITGTFPADKRTRAVSTWAAVAGGAAVLGLVTSGALLTVFSWRSIFGLNVLLSALALFGTLRFVPESADPDAPPLDIAFVAWERRQAAPLLDPRVFAQRSLSAGSLSIFIQFFAFFGYTFVILQYLQFVRGVTPLTAAVQVLPMALAMMPTARLAPRLTARFGTRWVCAAGLALLAAGLAIISQLQTDSSYWPMLAGLLIVGVGMGAAMTPATSAITEALPPAQQGVGSALNDLSREVGGAIGIAVIGSILTSTYSSHLDLSGVAGRIAEKAKGSVAVASHLGGTISEHANTAFVTAMHVALLTAAAVSLTAAAVVVVLLARRTELGPNGSLQAAVGRGAGSD